MITQTESQFRGRISSILQVFIEAAVTEICEFIELEVATLRSELSCRSERGSNVTRGKLTLQSTEENVSSGNDRRFASPDHSTLTLPHNISGRGLTEREILRNQETPDTSQPCAVWNQQSAIQDTKKDSLKECPRLDVVSVKKELLEESDRHEGDTSGADIPLHGASEVMGNGLEWTNAEASTHGSGKYGSKSEPACDGSTQCEVDTWDSAIAEKHYTQSAQLAQDVDLQHDQEDEEHSSTYLANWTDQTSPQMKSHSQAHHSMQYMPEEPNDSIEALGLDLPPGSSNFHSVRVDVSGSHLGMSVHHSMSLEERFICPMCGKMLRSDRALRAHMKDHTTLHICNHCGKSFARLTNLRVHQNIHMGLKPYTCKFCSKKFSDPSNYNRHKHRCPKFVHT